MIALAVAALVAICPVDGGGSYTLVSDFEWPGSDLPTSPGLIMGNDFANQTLLDGGTPIGSQQLRGYDGGLILTPRGLYFVRGKNGTPNVWANIHSWALGFPDTTYGGKYEVCYVPSYGSDECPVGSGQGPEWNCVPYVLDINSVTDHAVAFIPGAYDAGTLYVRLTGSGSTTLIGPAVLKAGQTYCSSAEWVPTDAGVCSAWVRHDSCEQTPTPMCEASTIIASCTNCACPEPSPTYVTFAQRQYGYDTSNLAPTTVTIGALRAGVKP